MAACNILINMTKTPPPLSEQDKALFHQAMEGVTPLAQKNKINDEPKHALQYNKHSAASDDESWDEDYFLPNEYAEIITGNEQLTYCNSSVSDRLFRKLKRGKIVIEDELDLHGLTIEQSSKQVSAFINFCLKNQLRTTRIIHGKGNTVVPSVAKLKTQLNAWLKEHPMVLAFCSCQPTHGGTGALYVLLKKQRGEDLE